MTTSPPSHPRGLLRLLCLLAAGTLPLAAAQPQSRLAAGPGGTLTLDGVPFRGAGVNYYDAFARSLGTPPAPAPAGGFQTLASNGIPFVRFAACGYWPSDWNLYRTNKEAHFQRLDAVVRLAEKHGIGLIPSLFWHPPTVPDLVGEPVSAWGNPEGKTLAFMRQYTTEVVRRHRDSRTIWAWEFGNEFNLAADLPNAASHRPPTHPALGTPAKRTAADDITHAQVRTAHEEFARVVRQEDATRLVFTGNGFPRDSAWHQQHEGSWGRDTPGQWTSMLVADAPGQISGLSGRLYTAGDLARIPMAMAASRLAGKPLFIGEFGVPGNPDPASTTTFDAYLDVLDREGVPLVGLWVFDFAGQDGEWSVTAENPRGVQLRKIRELNQRWSTRRRSPPPPG